MSPGDLVVLICDECLYVRGADGFRYDSATALRGDVVTVIQAPGRVTHNALVLHPVHGVGVLYGPSLAIVECHQ